MKNLIKNTPNMSMASLFVSLLTATRLAVRRLKIFNFEEQQDKVEGSACFQSYANR